MRTEYICISSFQLGVCHNADADQESNVLGDHNRLPLTSYPLNRDVPVPLLSSTGSFYCPSEHANYTLLL